MSTILAGNWKMNLGPAEASALAQELLPISEGLKSTTLWIAPVALSLPSVVEAVRSSNIRVGAQNVHWEESGAFTGEISVSMLREIGASFAIVGHSERRHVFFETDQLIAQRTLASLATGFDTILCIGETLSEREAGTTSQVLRRQLELVVPELSKDTASSLVIAYEPVWAIGTGKVATTIEIQEAHDQITSHWGELLSQGASGVACPVTCPPILYGGSVKPDNFAEINAIDNVSGALVGGASLKAESFSALAAIAEQAGQE